MARLDAVFGRVLAAAIAVAGLGAASCSLGGGAADGGGGGGGGNDPGGTGEVEDPGEETGGPCEPQCDGKECGDDGCGGSCGECGEGWTCNKYLNRCTGGCEPDCTGWECGDNGCGGSCGGCGPDEDCVEHACAQKASCSDGAKNGSETDVDCGGACPEKCAVGQGCGAAKDCGSGICEGEVCQADLSCKDGQKGGDETDVDCGGPKCAACAVGKFCAGHGDCLSLACIYGVCKEPTCQDGAKNQGEGDIDCGGPCPKCPDGKTCKGGADCASGTCAGGICASCDDGKKNGPETDVDCGGGCAQCADGKHCNKGSDCKGGGCEGGVCCKKNACGTCGALPTETCNGKDDDCDGVTDDAPTGGPDACPLQKGVCSGAKEKCKGASGWVCDAAGYKAYAAAYEETEKTCDGKDNDCDGQTDEGLLNACGKCGVVPKESCNGKDDDCNGKTDDTAACAACGAGEVELAKVDSGWGYQMAWKNSMALLGDEAYVFLHRRGNYSYTNLFRLVDGKLAASPSVAVSVVGNPHIAAGDGFLHLAVTGYNSGSVSWQHMYYYRLSPSGQVQTQVEVDEYSSNYSGAPSPVAVGGSTVGLVYWPSSGGPQYATIGYDGQTAQVMGPVTGADDYGIQLGIRKDGEAFVGTKFGSFEGPVYVEQVGTTSWAVDSGKCGNPHLRVAPDDTVWVVWESGASYDYDGLVKAWRLTKGGTEQGPEDIGTGKSPVVAFDPAGKPVVARGVGSSAIVISRKSGSGWTDETVWEAQGEETGGGPAGLEIDSAGRMHLEYHVYTPGDWNQYHAIRYRLICPSGGGTCTPDCTGKTCGDDGCGGSCGTCPSGCGEDPAATCAGKCGKFEPDAACKCNSACVSYGDCCADYEACCG